MKTLFFPLKSFAKASKELYRCLVKGYDDDTKVAGEAEGHELDKLTEGLRGCVIRGLIDIKLDERHIIHNVTSIQAYSLGYDEDLQNTALHISFSGGSGFLGDVTFCVKENHVLRVDVNDEEDTVCLTIEDVRKTA